MKILIIPDVHGRPFWRYAEENVNDFDKIVFLGDYHDPYYYEGISEDASLHNMRDLFNFARQNTNKCVMLCGNHDLSYIRNMDVGADRCDTLNYKEVSALFSENKDLLRLAYAIDADGIEVLFTHAGVLPGWKDIVMPDVPANAEDIAKELNLWIEEERESDALSHVSHIRGGMNRYGSCVWADLGEFPNERPFPFYQIFGHTQTYHQENGKLVFEGIITDACACLDDHAPHILYDGKISTVPMRQS